MFSTRSLSVVACIVLAAATPLSAQAPGNAGGACAYAERKTDNAYPDLCQAIGDNPHLQHYWSEAEAAGTSKAVIGLGLAALSLLSTTIASSNFSDNVNCFSSNLFSEKECDDKPVLPFMLIGGATMVADLIYLFTPNQKLDQARLATRDHYRDRYRDGLRKAPADTAPIPPSTLPQPVAPQPDQIEPADSLPPLDSIP